MSREPSCANQRLGRSAMTLGDPGKQETCTFWVWGLTSVVVNLVTKALEDACMNLDVF